MYNRRIFHWDHLNNLRQFIEIPDHLHKSIDIDTIVSELRSTRHQWNKIKQKTKTLRRKFLEERAERMAEKMHTSAENALKAIIKAEESKYNFSSIRSLTGKMNSSLTQVDVLADPNDPNSPKTTLTSKDEVEQAILHRNQIHSRQSLATPVAANPSLASAVHPFSKENSYDQILDGSFLDTYDPEHKLTPTERAWIQELQCKVSQQISLIVTVEDFKHFFKKKQECTSSSPSGRHMGHYKVMLDEIRLGRPEIAEVIINIAQISILVASPLNRWKRASQVMLEKGKGCFIENLRIIQLVEADLNFILHVFWGKRLTRHAVNNNALHQSQFALPGQTCQTHLGTNFYF